MGNQRSGIYLSLGYQIQDFLTVASIHTSRLEKIYLVNFKDECFAD